MTFICAVLTGLALCQVKDMDKMPHTDTLPILVSWYDPALCYDEGGNVIKNINCDDDPTQLATMPMDERLYGRVAACHADWTKRFHTTVVILPGIGRFWCVDRGGRIEPTCRDLYDPNRGWYYGCVNLIDILWDSTRWGEPAWQFTLVDDWGREHRGVDDPWLEIGDG